MLAKRQPTMEESDFADLETSRDSFHDGGFEVVQPVGQGLRGGLDALLLAASLPKSVKGLVADLGCGAGTAGLAALNLNANIELLGVEKNPTMFTLAENTITTPRNAKFRSRVTLLNTDVTATGDLRAASGLAPDSVDHVIMNPPYNLASQRSPADPLKREALMLGEGGIDTWFRTAASITRPGGTLVVIYRTENIGDIIASTRGRFGGLEILPIHSRENEAAKRIIVRSTIGSRAPLAILPGFVTHDQSGEFTPQADAIFKGKAHLEFG